MFSQCFQYWSELMVHVKQRVDPFSFPAFCKTCCLNKHHYTIIHQSGKTYIYNSVSKRGNPHTTNSDDGCCLYAHLRADNHQHLWPQQSYYRQSAHPLKNRSKFHLLVQGLADLLSPFLLIRSSNHLNTSAANGQPTSYSSSYHCCTTI